ncbi:Piwi domain-containing protein [Mycena rosella]|uniref:Piwi domain-containing protein n=1 Tax=Mycena rosella TaxID=1033263 RepID=A0AAD7DXY1_MYCRO|nr:Piwi domain-containing protein [Mycena rosella]
MASTEVSVITNSFQITRLPTKEYYQYDVRFRPDLPIATKRQRAMHILQTSLAPDIFNPRGVYDGKSIIYVSHQLRLPGGGPAASFPVRLGNDPNAAIGSLGVVEVILAKTASEVIRPKDLNRLIQIGHTIDPKTATATNLLQLLIRQSSNQNNPTNNGRAYFSSAGKRTLPGTGVELWRGFFQSVRPVIGRMLVTIDTSMAAVYESGPLLDVATHVLDTRNTRDLDLSNEHHFRKLQNHFKNKLIKTKTTGERTKTIHALERGPIGRYRFQKDDDVTTVAEHYYKAYGIRLAFPQTFGVRLSGKNAPFPVVVPAELCTVLPGQLYKKRLPTSTTKDVVDFATMNPKVRLQTIKGATAAGVQSPIQGYHTSEFIVDAGMVIDRNPIQVKAKLLAPPGMGFGTQTIMPNNGSWNVVNQRFKVAKAMKVWGVANFDPLKIRQEVENNTISEIIRCCRQLGMVVDPPVAVNRGDGAVERTLETILQQMLKKGPPDMIIVLLPKEADDIRTRVKFWGDIKKGVLTSCLREDKLQRANPAYFNNVVCRLNARLGGQYALPRYPPQLDVLTELATSPFMIFGLDVSHPGPGALKPSIVSVVWSWDQAAASYVAYSDVQTPRVEVIQDLRPMVRRAIYEFGKQSPPPKRLIFFRDGVSEGELETVRTEEIAAIKVACQDVWTKMKITAALPTITFIVVVKRHHTLFFPNESRVDDGKGNCRAGLVVDELRSPLAQDFYLQAHGGLKGTSKSGHYSILLDENFGDNIPKVQQLSFQLCHIYAKATRSISIPAPVYYADLVCARGKFHFDPESRDDLDFDSSTNASGSEDFDLARWKQAYRPVNSYANYDKKMYFL